MKHRKSYLHSSSFWQWPSHLSHLLPEEHATTSETNRMLPDVGEDGVGIVGGSGVGELGLSSMNVLLVHQLVRELSIPMHPGTGLPFPPFLKHTSEPEHSLSLEQLPSHCWHVLPEEQSRTSLIREMPPDVGEDGEGGAGGRGVGEGGVLLSRNALLVHQLVRELSVPMQPRTGPPFPSFVKHTSEPEHSLSLEQWPSHC
mmetsp:Transcript_25792/g.42951  ORF Transcript_25792/g.42951 Transcript_25792/m.42951 type:complete len:200 (+) Transcript_25792:203-802(+)